MTTFNRAVTLEALFATLGARFRIEMSEWAPQTTITGIAVDSRAVEPGNLFVARQGLTHDAAAFVPDALRAGASAVLLPAGAPSAEYGVPAARVEELPLVLGMLVDTFYGRPSSAFTLIGVTGTNGKTSVSHYVAQALHALGKTCAVIGTLGHGVLGSPLREGSHTTPDVVDVHRMMAEFECANVDCVVMEVSSHALDQGRVAGLHFDVAAFTNLTRDHLDYHGSLEAYGAAKARLFDWPTLRARVANVNDTFGAALATKYSGQPSTIPFAVEGSPDAYALQRSADPMHESTPKLAGRVLAENAKGLVLEVRSAIPGNTGFGILETALVGRFNAENLLTAMAVLIALCVPFTAALGALRATAPASGRMERVAVEGPTLLPTVVVDYAHTPDALAVALKALEGARSEAALWCVFGCGGDRDTGKRVQMGEVARERADNVVVTSDNPRSEAPGAIIDEILRAWPNGGASKAPYVEVDRARAIELAITKSAANDTVLIAGKGHETYQIVGDQRLEFDDREIAARALEARAQC